MGKPMGKPMEQSQSISHLEDDVPVSFSQDPSWGMIAGLVNVYSLLLKWPVIIVIVDLPMKNGDCP